MDTLTQNKCEACRPGVPKVTLVVGRIKLKRASQRFYNGRQNG